MEIASLILTILFGLMGIGVSIYCWRHNYEEQRKNLEIIKELNALRFDDEYSFSKLTEIIQKAKKENIDISNYFNKPIKNNSESTITRNEVMSSIYNMIMNSDEKFQQQETDTKN